MAVKNGRRHQLGRFAAGVAEHDPLIACALVLVARRVHALGDVGRLRMQQHLDRSLAPMKSFLFVTNVVDCAARRLLDHSACDSFGTACFAGDDDAVCRRHGLAGNPQILWHESKRRTFAEEEIDDLIRNPVADLVGVAFGHALAGKEVICCRHLESNPSGEERHSLQGKR